MLQFKMFPKGDANRQWTKEQLIETWITEIPFQIYNGNWQVGFWGLGLGFRVLSFSVFRVRV